MTTKTKDRFLSFPLHDRERPKRLHVYYVTGRGYFPHDMLRYDSCWPSDSEAAAAIAETRYGNGGLHCIKMHSYCEPTVARWESFLWSVEAEKIA